MQNDGGYCLYDAVSTHNSHIPSWAKPLKILLRAPKKVYCEEKVRFTHHMNVLFRKLIIRLKQQAFCLTTMGSYLCIFSYCIKNFIQVNIKIKILYC